MDYVCWNPIFDIKLQIDPCYHKDLDKYMVVLKNFLQQIVKIRGLNNTKTQRHIISDMTNRMSRAQLCCSDVLDRISRVFDPSLVTIIYQYTWDQVIMKLSDSIADHELIKFNSQAIVNLTSFNISQNILTVLSLGPKFCFPRDSSDYDWTKTVSELDELMDNYLLPSEINIVSRRIIKKLELTHNKLKQSKSHPSNISEFLRKSSSAAYSFLASISEVVLVLNADKGNKTVLMYKETYKQKVAEMMLQTDTYLLQNAAFDFEKIRAKHNSLIDEGIKLGILSQHDRWKFCKKLYTCPKFYGLPKTHKPDYPLRPITSTVDSLGYEFASFLAEFLKKFDEGDPCHILNSIELKQFLDTFIMPPNHIFVSLDVISMFTNIPVKTALVAVKRRMLEKHCNHKVINFVYRSLEFILTDCAVFSANGQLYKQIRGLAMGSPLSPILSRFVMSDLIKTKILSSFSITEVAFFKIYVDDSIASVHTDHVDLLLNSVNSFHQSIQFTCEKDVISIHNASESSINFLDMTIFRDHYNNVINTCWYKKPYSSGRLLNYYSNHSPSTIKGVAVNIIDSIINLSSPRYRSDNIRTIYDILSLNSYPIRFITTLLVQSLLNIKDSNLNKDQTYFPLTYSRALFNNIQTIINEFIPQIHLCSKPDNSNFQLHFSPIKDLESPDSRRNCVVTLACQKCKKVHITCTQYDCNVSQILDTARDPLPSSNCTHNLNRQKFKISPADSHTKTKILLPYIHAKYTNKVIDTDSQPRNLSLYRFTQDKYKSVHKYP